MRDPGDRRLRVVILDDEEPVRRALRRLFLAADVDVETFATGEELLAFLSTSRPDCAVIDLHMPGLTGLEVLERIVAAGIEVPAVIISGNDQAGLAERAVAAGASAFLSKPLDEKVLLAAIEEAVRGSGR